MDNFTSLPNIGSKLDELIKQAGINNISEFKSLGCENVFIRLQAIDKDVCMHKLYAIEGAIQGIHKKDITKERKEELRHFFSMVQK